MSSDPATDCASLAALQQGDTTALNRLIARWQRPLLSYAYRYLQNSADAHDLVASVFVRLYKNRDRFRPDTNLSAWLFTTLTNLCHNHHRWKRRHPAVSLDTPSHETDDGRDLAPFPDLASDEPEPGTNVARDELERAVRDAIAALPPDLRSAILLHHYQHLSYREIAEIAGCSERGGETRLYRARQLLRVTLATYIREASSC